MNDFATNKNAKIKKFLQKKYGFDSIYDAKCKKIHIAACLVQILNAFAGKNAFRA